MSYGSGRRLGSSTTERRRSATLHDHPVGSGSICRPQDRPEVVRVFDAVEYNEQRRPLGTANQLLDIVPRHVVNDGDDALMYTAA
jgi:hypothetical protein